MTATTVLLLPVDLKERITPGLERSAHGPALQGVAVAISWLMVLAGFHAYARFRRRNHQAARALASVTTSRATSSAFGTLRGGVNTL